MKQLVQGRRNEAVYQLFQIINTNRACWNSFKYEALRQPIRLKIILLYRWEKAG